MHVIETLYFPSTMSRDEIRADADQWANCNCDPWESGLDGGLFHPIEWHDDVVYEDEVAAAEAIGRLDRHDYNQIAVLFRRCDEGDVRKAIEKERATLADLRARAMLPCVCNRKAKMVSCPVCGSKINKSWLTKGDGCPVCGGSLRTDAEQRGYDRLNDRIAVAERRLEDARKRAVQKLTKAGRYEVCWAVKLEVHC